VNKTIEEDLKAKIVELEKWIELYKAQANGKIIQWEQLEDRWVDLPQDHSFTDAEENGTEIEEYRIKPDESTFKVGDWVKDMHGVYCKISDIGNECVIYTNNKGYRGSMDFWYLKEQGITPWQPQEGEWCVFWTEDIKYVIAKFNCYIDNKTPSYVDWDGTVMISRNVVPLEFVQTLNK